MIGSLFDSAAGMQNLASGSAVSPPSSGGGLFNSLNYLGSAPTQTPQQIKQQQAMIDAGWKKNEFGGYTPSELPQLSPASGHLPIEGMGMYLGGRKQADANKVIDIINNPSLMQAQNQYQMGLDSVRRQMAYREMQNSGNEQRGLSDFSSQAWQGIMQSLGNYLSQNGMNLSDYQNKQQQYLQNLASGYDSKGALNAETNPYWNNPALSDFYGKMNTYMRAEGYNT